MTERASTAKGRWPLELRLLKGRQALRVRFDDELTADLPARLLRAYSPSAELQGHGSQTVIDASIPEDVTIRGLERVGTYAVRLLFSDGHDTGFYTWSFLEDFALTLDDKAGAFSRKLADQQA